MQRFPSSQGTPLPMSEIRFLISRRSWQGVSDLSIELEIWVSCSAAHLGICHVSFHDGNRESTLLYSNASVVPAKDHPDTIPQGQWDKQAVFLRMLREPKRVFARPYRPHYRHLKSTRSQ